ncbi:hypothetical protein EDD15DRAFT_2365686 [Pisolithus albus]|nr:hypothetical protein EDD15DRAFT_2365686 [Pisolithus albus]
MFRQYQLRTASGSNGSRSSSARPASLVTGSRGSTRTSSLSNSLLPSVARPAGFINTTAADFELDPPPSSQPRQRRGPPSDVSSHLEDSISAGIRRRRSDPPDDFDSDPTQLSPRRVKRLKIYAKDLCKELDIPEKNLLDFVETGNMFHMLVNVKASLIKNEIEFHTNKSNALQEILATKDFESALYNRLLACLLSPNITAYVTDTQRHIMDFIFEHQDIFKIPAGVFDDAELKTSLRTIVSKALAGIRSQLKTQLISSIAKKTCIVDVTKSLARASSGMEVEAAHWNRMAFLRRCLRIFLIGTGDLKYVSLDVCFTPRLIPMLKADMQRKLERELDINFNDMEKGFAEEGTSDGALESTCNNDPRVDPNSTEEQGASGDADAEREGTPDVEDINDGIDDLGEEDSGFGLEGKPVRFCSSKFWNYVDYMLDVLRDTARQDTSTKEEFEKGITRFFRMTFWIAPAVGK